MASKKEKEEEQLSIEQISLTMNRLRRERFEAAQKRVSEFLSELESDGFGLDATIEVSRYGNKVKIFVVSIENNSHK